MEVGGQLSQALVLEDLQVLLNIETCSIEGDVIEGF